MKTAKNQNRRSGGKVSMKLKRVLLMLLVTVLSVSSIVTANAVTVKDDGKYTLLLTCGLNGMATVVVACWEKELNKATFNEKYRAFLGGKNS